MNKPMTIIREELKAQIAEAINDSKLPAFAIEPILQEFLFQIKNVAMLQYENDKQEYEKFLNSQAEKGE